MKQTEWTEIALGGACTKIGSGATPRGGKEAYLEVASTVEMFYFCSTTVNPRRRARCSHPHRRRNLYHHSYSCSWRICAGTAVSQEGPATTQYIAERNHLQVQEPGPEAILREYSSLSSPGPGAPEPIAWVPAAQHQHPDLTSRLTLKYPATAFSRPHTLAGYFTDWYWPHQSFA